MKPKWEIFEQEESSEWGGCSETKYVIIDANLYDKVNHCGSFIAICHHESDAEMIIEALNFTQTYK